MKNQIESRGAPDAAHTPGPWRSSPDDPLVVEAYGKLTIDGSEQKWIATICKHDLPSYECEANARLIAQAPTLLAENEKLRAGHVLLEALRGLAKATRNTFIQLRDFADDKDTALLHSAGELRSALVEAEAAIKQAERT